MIKTENKKLLVILIAVLTLIGIGVFFLMKPKEKTKVTSESFEYETLLRSDGSSSRQEVPLEKVIKNEQELAVLYPSLGLSEDQSIDFGKHDLIVVALGQRSNGGYSVEIKEIKKEANDILVLYTETVPGQSCFTTQAITFPYHIVKVNKINFEVKFSKTSITNECK